MTWLLVRISPDDPMTMPVPAACPGPPARVVLTVATAGSTDDWMLPTFSPPPELWAPAAVAVKPTRRAPVTKAASAAKGRDRRGDPGRVRGDQGRVMPPIVASEPLNPLRNR